MTEIKGIRKKLGFSRHALALILDWELATVIRYEHGVLIKKSILIQISHTSYSLRTGMNCPQ